MQIYTFFFTHEKKNIHFVKFLTLREKGLAPVFLRQSSSIAPLEGRKTPLAKPLREGSKGIHTTDFFNISQTAFGRLNSTNKRNRVDQADHVCIVCKYTTNF